MLTPVAHLRRATRLVQLAARAAELASRDLKQAGPLETGRARADIEGALLLLGTAGLDVRELGERTELEAVATAREGARC